MSKVRKTTLKDAREGKCEMRAAETKASWSELGKSGITLVCPFCNAHVRAYYWSLAGCGKRCDCGAIFGHTGNAYRLKGGAE